jgi:hypothetical protein
MGAYKEIYTEIQTEMWDVAELLNKAAEDGDMELMSSTIIECTAKLAILARRYHQVTT